MAIDIRVPDVKLDELHSAARALKIGGVGFYPDLNFVHVDVGRVAVLVIVKSLILNP